MQGPCQVVVKLLQLFYRPMNVISLTLSYVISLINFFQQILIAGPLPGGRQTAATVAPKCTKEEIERKRQEALRKRQMIQNTQKQKF